MAGTVFFNVSHNIGGAEISLLELSRGWQGELGVICPEGSQFEDRIRREQVELGGIQVPILRGGSGLFSKLTNFTYARRARSELERICKARPWEIFVSNNLMADYFAGEVPNQYCQKTVCYCRDLPAGDVKTKFLDKRDMIIAPSQYIADELQRAGYEHITYVPNGLDISWFEKAPRREAARKQLGLPEDGTIISYACQFVRRKGLLTFIDTAETLATKMDNLYFPIAGGDLYQGSPFVNEVKRRIDESPIKDRFIMTGYQIDMRPFYAAADLFLSLSINEPFGRTPLEAALCGTLPITSKGGGYAETVGDVPALLVDPGRIDQVFAAVTEFLSDRGRKDTLLQDIQAVARTYNITRTRENLQEALEKVIGNGE